MAASILGPCIISLILLVFSVLEAPSVFFIILASSLELDMRRRSLKLEFGDGLLMLLA